MKQFYTKYIENEGYAVIRRTPQRKEWVIFYCDTPEHAEQQAEVRNVWSEHQKKINEIESRTRHYPPTQSVLSELIQLKDALRIRKGKNHDN